MTDLVQHISEIARLFWGPENRALSSRTELRWEKRRPRGQSQHRTVVRPFRVSRRRRCRLDATAVRANCVAAGIPFAGLKTLQGPVIYNCGEGNSGFLARLFAAGRRLGIGRDDSLPLFVLDEAPDFGHERCSSQCDRPGDVVRRPTARVGTLDMERARPWYHPSWCTWLQTPSPGNFAPRPSTMLMGPDDRCLAR